MKQFRLKGEQEATQTIPPDLLRSTEESLFIPQHGVIDTDISPILSKCHTGHDTNHLCIKTYGTGYYCQWITLILSKYNLESDHFLILHCPNTV